MSLDVPLHPSIDLFVSEKISCEDAARQMNTARAILERFRDQPGVVLADEVGMGKTFVALAAAVSVTLNDPDRRPVVVMVPSSVKDKWPRDFEVFRENCVSPEVAEQLTCGVASRAVEFLKLVDDPPERRRSLIFATHGAMSRNLGDPFVKFALLRQALKGRRGAEDLRRALTRFAGDLLQQRTRLDKRDPGLWAALLDKPPRKWRRVLVQREIDRPKDAVQYSEDDPVPEPLLDALPSLDTDRLFHALNAIPRRRSKNYQWWINEARQVINEELHQVWQEAIKRMRLSLPLVVLDEAHHAKNAGTQLATLFEAVSAEEDADELTGGALGGAFERMLFMTATPFQLGHHELCNVLQRFEGLAWDSSNAPPGGRERLQAEIANLRSELDAAQEAAVRLEQVWSRLGPEDLQADGTFYGDVEAWWQVAGDAERLTDRGRQALTRSDHARDRLKRAEAMLRQWVIRHTRPRQLPSPHYEVPRRRRITGHGIVDDASTGSRDASDLPGIPVQGDPALPFLLAARLVTCSPEARPVFAEGLASSYEAFLDTRRKRQDGNDVVDTEDSLPELADPDDAGWWYLERIGDMVGRGAEGGSVLAHPKLDATVQRALELWERGEKVLIFIHYIATGRALREALSSRIAAEIEARAARKLGVSGDRALDELIRLADRLDRGESAARACRRQVDGLLREFPDLAGEADRIHNVVLRFLRRPSFIVRYFDLADGRISAEDVDRAFEASDASGLTLREVVYNFLYFLERRCSATDRDAYLDAVESIQTGTHYGGEAVEDEQGESGTRAFVGNVRLINGATRHETRQRLMLAFNTPFFPEILVTSSVMSEGVDLHLNCRHIIHHDLAWNPSNLEQRTGRVDRIGAKAEYAGQPIHVYMPYVAETQDEKMYRVVMDRERWFNVVMGGRLVTSARAADKIAARIPLPESARNALMLDLSVRERE